MFDQLLKCGGMRDRCLAGSGINNRMKVHINQLKVRFRDRDLSLGCKTKKGPFDASTSPSVPRFINCFKNKRGLETDIWQEDEGENPYVV